MNYLSDRELLNLALDVLKKLSSDAGMEYYEKPKGSAGGQDSYVGCPAGMRHVDGVISSIEWTLHNRDKK